MCSLSDNQNKNKYIIFAINLVFLLTGIILLYIAVNNSDIYYSYAVFLVMPYHWLSVTAIFIGAFIIIFAFLACLAALKEHYCSILTFSTLLAVTSLLALAAGICSYILSSQALELIRGPLVDSMKEYKPDRLTPETDEWDYLQKMFSCCGVDSYRDWEDFFNELPVSCCFLPSGVLGSFNCTTHIENYNLHVFGCLSYFSYYIETQFASLGAAGISIGILMLPGFLLACYFARAFKSPSQKSDRKPRI